MRDTLVMALLSMATRQPREEERGPGFEDNLENQEFLRAANAL